MATLILKLDLEDISTTTYGKNVALFVNERFEIILSPEAARELVDDLTFLSGHQGNEFEMPAKNEPPDDDNEVVGRFETVDELFDSLEGE